MIFSIRLLMLSAWLVAGLFESAYTADSAARTLSKRGGAVLLAGGGETPREAILQFIQLAGGADAQIVILAHTQEDPSAGGERSAEMFRGLGARKVAVVSSIQPERVQAALHEARGVWIPGGDQNRFMQAFPEHSGVPQAIRDVVHRGGVAGGTSAGASLMGDLMPTGAQTRSRILSAGGCPVTKGLGLLPKAIVDQHFIARNRLLRLLAATLDNPGYIGIGLDEGAWALIRANRLQTHRGQVILIRAGRVSRRHERDSQEEDVLLGSDRVMLQVLLAGQSARL
jgi:cyanophycinase